MIDHLSTYATDYEATKSFYESVFDALGYSLQVEMVTEWDKDNPTHRICAFGPQGRPVFWVIEVNEASTPRHTAFTAQSRERVNRFHEAGLQSGGKDNGPPGPRPMYHEHYYGAFLLDPDGNNVEAVCHTPE